MADATLVLRDIHQAAAPPWWPPAPGWWLLAALGLLAVASWAWFAARRRKRRRAIAAIFDQTLAALDVEPDEAVHVGDDVTADVGGAKDVGMRAVWYDTGTWPGADGSRADAVIHSWRELPEVVARW